MRTDRSGVGSDITLLRPIVHLTEEELSFRGRKRKKRSERKTFRALWCKGPKPNTWRSFIYFLLQMWPAFAGASLTFTSAACYVKRQEVRTPRNRYNFVFPRRNCIIDPVIDPAKIPSSIATEIPKRIAAPKFRSPNLRADFSLALACVL
jgi:hypothetical protein